MIIRSNNIDVKNSLVLERIFIQLNFFSGCKWTIEILYSKIIDDVINFNKVYKSTPVYYQLLNLYLNIKLFFLRKIIFWYLYV